MGVPLLDLNGQNSALGDELRAAFERVFTSGRFILGEEVEAFEREVAEFCGAKHALGVSSGSDALILALMALGVEAGDEVICPSFTFFATAGALARLGAVPVFADVCPYCFNLAPEDVASKITPRTKGIIPVHLFGQAAEMEELLALAKAHNLFVLEDCAQALGAAYKAQKVGTLGEFGTFSFFPSKNLGGFGDAGMLTTNDDGLYAKAKMLRSHGMEPKYHHHLVGGNFRIDALQSALLRVKLPHLNGYAAARMENAAYYREQLGGLPGAVSFAGEVDACQLGQTLPAGATVVLPYAYPHCTHIWNQFTLRFPRGNRDAVKDQLLSKGIGCEIYYPIPLHQQKCFEYLPAVELPVTDTLAKEVLSIPVYPELTRAQQDEVIATVAEALT